jgi:hypothetical protein
MKTNFNSKLFKKQIDSKKLSNIFGSDFSTSGGTESGPTTWIDGSPDIYTNIYNDNCELNIGSICH